MYDFPFYTAGYLPARASQVMKKRIVLRSLVLRNWRCMSPWACLDSQWEECSRWQRLRFSKIDEVTSTREDIPFHSFRHWYLGGVSHISIWIKSSLAINYKSLVRTGSACWMSNRGLSTIWCFTLRTSMNCGRHFQIGSQLISSRNLRELFAIPGVHESLRKYTKSQKNDCVDVRGTRSIKFGFPIERWDWVSTLLVQTAHLIAQHSKNSRLLAVK